MYQPPSWMYVLALYMLGLLIGISVFLLGFVLTHVGY
jgi:uncharacterized membrane protein (DUF485 family)